MSRFDLAVMFSKSDIRVIDIEITLNRFGFSKISTNKLQFGFIRISWWTKLEVVGKVAISFEVNWKS